jgi:hypothetical protein
MTGEHYLLLEEPITGWNSLAFAVSGTGLDLEEEPRSQASGGAELLRSLFFLLKVSLASVPADEEEGGETVVTGGTI